MSVSQATRARKRRWRERSGNAVARLRGSIRQALHAPVRRRRRERAHRAAMQRARRDPAAVWEVIATMLLRFGGASSGNRVQVFCDGDETFEAIWEAIATAQKRVWCETYILEPDRVGRRTIDALTQAAKRGCAVRLLYDALGSPRVNDEFLAPLREAGGEIVRFNPILSWRRRHSLLTRDHRKIIVIDNHTAFAGGMNISEDYAGLRCGNGRFRDCQVRVEGPCVHDLANVLLGSLRLMQDGVEQRDRLPATGRRGGTFVQVLSSRGAAGRRPIQRAIRLTVRFAVDRCWITTPYFVPPHRLMKAMIHAAKRGVDVRILTAGECDVPIVRLAAQHIYGQLLRHGVRIFEMFDSTLHAKTMVIDGLYATVGSFNLDTWSDKRNLEVNVAMIDADVARIMEEDFQRSADRATEVTLETWKKRNFFSRSAQWLAYQLMRI